jgi:hypothetical protein
MNQRSENPDAIQDDIHRTRDDIDQSLAAIADKLSPGELFSEVMGWVRQKGGDMHIGSKAGDAMSSVLRTAKDNPVPAALIGLGLLGLMRDGRSSSDGKTREGASKVADKVPDKVQDAASEAREGASKVVDKVQDMASDARESLQHGVEKVRHRIEDDPVVLGALGIALGAALGAALPRTRIEDEKLGPKRDELVSKAKHVGEQIRDETKHVARELTHAARGESGGDGQRVASEGSML